MKQNTKLYWTLRFFYFEKGKSFTAQELSERVGIKKNFVSAYALALHNFVGKKKINGLYHYSLKEKMERNVRYLIANATKPFKDEQKQEQQIPDEKTN